MIYEPLELHVIIHTPLQSHLGEKDPKSFERDMSIAYVSLRADPLGSQIIRIGLHVYKYNQ